MTDQKHYPMPELTKKQGVKVIVSYLDMDFGNHDHVNAWEVVRTLGITFEKSEPSTQTDSVHFFGCENIPDALPDYVRVVDL